MIWYNEPLNLEGQPSEVTISLLGGYNESKYSMHKLCILFLINDQDQETNHVIEVQDPSSLSYEDPPKEDIYAKYQGKMSKIMKSATTRDYKSFLIWVKSRSLFNRGRSQSY